MVPVSAKSFLEVLSCDSSDCGDVRKSKLKQFLNFNSNFHLLFKTSRRMTTLPQMTTKQIADVLKTIPSVGGNKEEEEKKKIKLHQYPTLAVRSARIVN